MTFKAHLECNLLLVFVNDGDRQSEADDNEIDRGACRRERRDPATLTATLISDPATARAGNSLCLPHSGHGIICERIEILRVTAFRAAGSPFVIDEGADVFRW